LYVHVYTVNGGIRMVVCTCIITSEWENPYSCMYMYTQWMELYGFPHSLFIHVHTTIRILPFSVYACTYNYTDSPFTVYTCTYNYTDPPFTVFICTYNYTDPPFTVYTCTYNWLYVHVYTVNEGIRIVVYTCINSKWENPYSCMYMYKQWMGESVWLYVHVYTVPDLPTCGP
jgi:hypothetical protein